MSIRRHTARTLSGAALTALAAFATACASSSSGSAGDPSTDSQPATPAGGAATTTPAPTPTPGVGPMWQGEIRPESGSKLGGTVMLMPNAQGQTTATVTLTGGSANGVHPWHVHSGTCAEKGPIVGAPSAYTPLSAYAMGAARLEATLPFADPTSGNYSVNVLMSATQMGMIVGCADLRM